MTPTMRNPALAVGCSFTPLWRSREAQNGEARAQHASSTDFAQLSDRSVAKGVLREPRRSSIAGHPSQRGDGAGATFCLLFGRSKRRSPAGANSRHHARQTTEGART